MEPEITHKEAIELLEELHEALPRLIFLMKLSLCLQNRDRDNHPVLEEHPELKPTL